MQKMRSLRESLANRRSPTHSLAHLPSMVVLLAHRGCCQGGSPRMLKAFCQGGSTATKRFAGVTSNASWVPRPRSPTTLHYQRPYDYTTLAATAWRALSQDSLFGLACQEIGLVSRYGMVIDGLGIGY